MTNLDQKFSVATDAAADLFSSRGVVTEKALVGALRDALIPFVGAVTVGRHFPVPGWDPKPGGTDLITGPPDTPTGLVETKISRASGQPKLFEALWDAYKLAAQVGREASAPPHTARG